MPPPALARIDEVADAVVARVKAEWNPTSPSAVTAPDVPELDTKKLKGRQVYVLPDSFTGGPVTRAEDANDYTLVLLVAEVYPHGGTVDKKWRRERTAFCEWLVNDVLGDPRAARLLAVEGDPNSGLWPESAEVSTVYDVEELEERKLLLSVLRITFREHAG
jgi:hypothetical protein